MSEVTEKVVVQETPETTFPLATLRAKCKDVFGVDTAVFDGVFYGHSEDITITDAKAKIEVWLKKEVK